MRHYLNLMHVGVLYAKEGQKTEEEILGNRTYTCVWLKQLLTSRGEPHQTEESSEAFDRFLGLLGDKVTLEGWKGYRGDLDVNQNKNGEYSVYTKLHNEIEVLQPPRSSLFARARTHAQQAIDANGWMFVFPAGDVPRVDLPPLRRLRPTADPKKEIHRK
jgi:hypothetical protein